MKIWIKQYYFGTEFVSF